MSQDGHSPIAEQDLHAFVDGQLDAERAQRVAAYIAANANAARTVEAYRALNRGLNALFAEDLERDRETGSAVLPPLACAEQRHNPWWKTAVAAAVVAVSVALGWSMHALMGVEQTPLITDLAAPATFAHAVFASDAVRPVEIGPEHRDQLEQWLSTRMNTTMLAPDLVSHGFRLLGGRLLPSTGRMAAQFMYQDTQGRRISLYQRKGEWSGGDKAFGYLQRDGVASVFWTSAKMGYALTGALDKVELLALAAAIPGAPHRVPAHL